MAAPPTAPELDPTLEPLVGALRRLLRSGLPLRPEMAPEELLNLRSVIARSVEPHQRLARVDGLERLLRAELKVLGLVKLRKAAQALFGFGSAAGLTLTERRHRAATLAGYELDHFRKRIEPRICRQLAWQLHQDGLQYVRRSGGGDLIAASGPTPTIHSEHIERPDTAAHEALLSRIWSDVYGLRAELILREAVGDDGARAAEFEAAEIGSKWYLARLLTALDRYMERYGVDILHGASEYDARSLIRLAGWTGELNQAEARTLRFALARCGEDDRPSFTAAITADPAPVI